MFTNNIPGHKPTQETLRDVRTGRVDPSFFGPPEPSDPLPESTHSKATTEEFHSAAHQWYEFGLKVIPTVPGEKKTALKWDQWLVDLSTDAITAHWRQHPDNEVGFIVGPDLIVFDADSPEAITAFYQLLSAFDLCCNHIVATSKGEHYYFKLAPGTLVRSDAHDTTQYPARLDIKTGRALIVLPPSTGKSVSLSEAACADDLIEVGQDFIDAVYRHNGREEPRLAVSRERALTDPAIASIRADEIAKFLQVLDPDCGYDDWVSVGMAIHHTLNGDTSGFELFDDWSRKGNKYPGWAELDKKWSGFAGYTGVPMTMGTIWKLAADSGADLEGLFEEFFDAIDDADLDTSTDADTDVTEHDLAKYSLRGMSAQFEAEMQEQVCVLGKFALMGQWTVLYAAPNDGKTLITIHEVIQGIKSGVIDPDRLFYINADDNHAGLTAKLKLAERYGFHMLAPGYLGFRARDFLQHLRRLCANGQARGTIVILDTLKKFTDPMDKRTASDFGSELRVFIAKGGTVIALAHVNKNRDANGKRVHSGTSDIVDDADCVYMIDTIGDDKDVRTVEFENIKSRGLVAKRTAYKYSTVEGQSYKDLLASVTPVDEPTADALRQASSQAYFQDLPLIQAIASCINDGITAKTKIVEKAALVTGESQRRAQRVLEAYTGTDPIAHSWNFSIGNHGVKNYQLLPPPEDLPDIEEL